MSILPPKLLKVQMLSQSPVGFWESVDLTDPWIGSPFKWEVELTVEAQFHGSNLTPSLFSYDGNDIKVGDWLATNSGGTAVRVAEILEASAGTAKVVLEDVDAYNMITDPTSGGNSIGPTGVGYVFSLNSQGMPIIPSATAFYLDVSFQTDLMSRFEYLSKGSTGDHIKNDAATTGVYTQLEDHANQIVFQQAEDKLVLSHSSSGWDLKAVGPSINDDVDITIQPQNNGAVVIGNEGSGYIESAPGEDLTLRGSNVRLETHDNGEVILGNAGDSLLRTDEGSSLTLEATEIVFTPRSGTLRVTDSDAYLALLREDGHADALITKGFLDGYTGGAGGSGGTSPADKTRIDNLETTTSDHSSRIEVLEDHADSVDTALLDVVKLNEYNSKGDLLVAIDSNEVTALPVGKAGQVLTVVDGSPTWVNPQGGEPDRISTDDTSVETKQVENSVTVNAGGRRVANFASSEGASDEQLNITTAAGKIQLAAGGVSKSDLELSNPTGGRIKFLATGDASIRSGAAESFLVKPGDSTTGAGATLTLAGGDTAGTGETGGNVLIQPGSSGSGGLQGQVKLPVGYEPTDMDSVVPRHYVDDLTLSSVGAPTSNVSMNNRRMTALAAPTAEGDAANKQYVDARATQWTTHVVTSGSAYTASLTDHVILVAKNASSATTIELPETDIVGRVFVIKDAAGTAGEHAITITASASKLDGADSYVLNIAHASITALWNGSSWSVL